MGLKQPNPQHGVGGGAPSLPQDRYITTMVVQVVVYYADLPYRYLVPTGSSGIFYVCSQDLPFDICQIDFVLLCARTESAVGHKKGYLLLSIHNFIFFFSRNLKNFQ